MDYSNLINQTASEDALASLIVGAGILLIFALIIIIPFIVVYLVALAKLFKKGGKPGWAAIVPFYNSYVLVEIAGLYWWYFLIAISGTIFEIVGLKTLTPLATIASMAVNFFIFYNLAKKMHKDPIKYAVLAIFFAPIMAMILGFGKAEYDASVSVSPNGPIGDNTKNTSVPESYCLGCGKKLREGTKFCENCGKEVKDNIEETPTEEKSENEEPENVIAEEPEDHDEEVKDNIEEISTEEKSENEEPENVITEEPENQDEEVKQ